MVSLVMGAKRNRWSSIIAALTGVVILLLSHQSAAAADVKSPSPFELNPEMAFPLEKILVRPFPDGSTNRTQADDLTPGWTPSRVSLDGFINMYNPNISRTGNAQYPYEMWFFGWAATICNQPWPIATYCDSIFYARAASLTGPWQVYTGDVNGVPQYDALKRVSLWKPVIRPRETYWDNWHNGDPSVIKVNGTYFMAYSQTGDSHNGLYPQLPKTPPYTYIDNESIGGAYSTDGIHWTRLTRPLLVSRQDPMDGSRPIGSHFARPSLMYDNGKLKLWYDYWAGPEKGLAMGYAELPGPLTVANFQNQVFSVYQGVNSPAISQWPNPNVIKVGGYYIAASDARARWEKEDWAQRYVSFAISRNGIDWTVAGYIKPDADCVANMVPELMVSQDKIILATGCYPKTKGTPAGRMTSIRIRSIPTSTFLASIEKLRPEFFKAPVPKPLVLSRPACVAPATDQTYLQSTVRYFSPLANTLNAGKLASQCLSELQMNLSALRSSNWPCTNSSVAVSQTMKCVNDVSYLMRGAPAAGKAFIDAFIKLSNAKSQGITGSKLTLYINLCIVQQIFARNWGVEVDQYQCK